MFRKFVEFVIKQEAGFFAIKRALVDNSPFGDIISLIIVVQ